MTGQVGVSEEATKSNIRTSYKMGDNEVFASEGQESELMKAEVGKSERMGTRQTIKAAFESGRRKILKGFSRMKGSSEHQHQHLSKYQHLSR